MNPLPAQVRMDVRYDNGQHSHIVSTLCNLDPAYAAKHGIPITGPAVVRAAHIQPIGTYSPPIPLGGGRMSPGYTVLGYTVLREA